MYSRRLQKELPPANLHAPYLALLPCMGPPNACWAVACAGLQVLTPFSAQAHAHHMQLSSATVQKLLSAA